MQKRAPTLGNILVIVLFVLCCFGLLLFFWQTFGGPVALKSKGYRVVAVFPRTLALAEQSDVRISGVNVGHVVSLKQSPNGRTDVTMEIASRYAPLRANDRVKIRQKTILGETFVQIIPGKGKAPVLKNEASLPETSVEPIVTLDAIFSTFSPKVRQAFRTWMISQAQGFAGEGEQLNASFAILPPFLDEANKLLGALQAQQGAVDAAIRGTGEVFDALTERKGQLKSFIVNGERAFAPAAKESREWAEAFEELPGFERNSQRTLRSFDQLADEASPVLDQLRPAERALTPLLHQAESFSPPFNDLLTSLGPLTDAAKRGLPALGKSLQLTTPLLKSLRPVLHNFDPFLQYTDEYLPSVQALFANFAAASNAHINDSNLPGSLSGYKPHYLRSLQYVNAESLAVYPQRIGTNRANAYPHSGAFGQLGSGLSVFDSSNCADSAPAVEGPANEYVSQAIIEQLIELKIVNAPESAGNAVPAPACTQQGPFTFNGKTSQFPQVSP